MFRSYLTAGLLAVCLSACTGGDGPGESSELARSDAVGEVQVPSDPNRIVSLVPVATEILFEIGAGDRLVGRSRWDDYPPAALAVVDVGDAIRPSIERVLLQRPDLVILVGGSDNAQAAAELDRLSVPFVVVRFNTLADLEEGIRLLGGLVDREREADDLWRRVRTELAEVSAVVGGRERPTVYYDVGYPPAFTVGAGSYLDTLITIAGGTNVFHDVAAPSPQVSLESILGRDPDVLIHPVGSEGPMASTSPADRPGWKALRAVQAGNVRHVSAALTHRLGPRLGAAARELAAAIHPELASELGP